jgi:hypothetical protein
MTTETRVFPTGASRDTDEGKLDYEGFLSPRVLRRYAEYMQGHTTMADGTRRASDNWQKGIPREAYLKSLLRHTMELWEMHRTQDVYNQDTLCAIVFNAMGLLHEELKLDDGAWKLYIIPSASREAKHD